MTATELAWGRDMTAIDYLMYRGEKDPRTRSSIMSIEILEDEPDWKRLRADLDRASRAVIRLRQRVVVPTLPITSPQWVVDPDFNLDYHLRRVRCPAPGTMRQLLDLAQSLYAGPLDMSRPLWEATLVEGLDADGGKAALLWKLSHALTDGVGAIEMDRHIRSYSPEPPVVAAPLLPVPEDITAHDLTSRALRRLPLTLATGAGGRAVSVVGAGRRALGSPVGTVKGVVRYGSSLQRLLSGPPASPSPLLRARSINRRFETLSFPFAALRAAAKQHGCSVNDAYIAGLCGALRLYHERQGAPTETISLALPVNLRQADDPAAGNQWAAVRICGPLGESDPVRRMHMVREQVLTGRSEPAINALTVAAPALARLPVEVLTSMAEGVICDIQASNVPGHAQDTYIGGVKVISNYPFGPLPGSAMMIVMMSHVGQCYIGVNYDTTSVTDPEAFSECLAAGFAEMFAVVPQQRDERRLRPISTASLA